MSAGWDDGSIDEKAVHEREQLEAELRDIIGEARLLFVVAASLKDGQPDAVVRGMTALPVEMDDEERATIVLAFLTTARAELDEMIEQLTTEPA